MRRSRGHRRARDQRSVVVERDPLFGNRDDDLKRSLGSVAGLSVRRHFRFRRCGSGVTAVPVMVPGPERIAPPGPLGPKLGVGDPRRKDEGSKCRRYCRADVSQFGASGDGYRHRTLTAHFSRRPHFQAVPIQPGQLVQVETDCERRLNIVNDPDRRRDRGAARRIPGVALKTRRIADRPWNTGLTDALPTTAPTRSQEDIRHEAPFIGRACGLHVCTCFDPAGVSIAGRPPG